MKTKKTFFTCKVVSGGERNGEKKRFEDFCGFNTLTLSAYVGGYHKQPQPKNRKKFPLSSPVSLFRQRSWLVQTKKNCFLFSLLRWFGSVDEDDDDPKSNRSQRGWNVDSGHGTTRLHNTPTPSRQEKNIADVYFFY
jgi:hypothetical protein